MTMGRVMKHYAALPPSSIAYLASSLLQDSHHVEVLDQFAMGMNTSDAVRFALEGGFEIIGISLLAPSVGNAAHFVSEVRKNAPNIKFIIGNAHASIMDKETVESGLADFVVRGEGEITLRELVGVLERGGDLEQVLGITWRDQQGEIQKNPDRPTIEDLDSLPYPAWEIFKTNYYPPPVFRPQVPYLGMTASRGCSYNCYYCAQNYAWPTLRLRDPLKVAAEFAHFHDRLGFNLFAFNDANFPPSESFGLKFCEEIKRLGLNGRIRYVANTRPQIITERLLDAMVESGLYMIQYGIEVADESFMKSMNRRQDLENTLDVMRWTRKRREVISFGLFMLGLPGQSRSEIRKTVDFAIKAGFDFAKFNRAVPYPGSAFFDDVKESAMKARPELFSAWSDNRGGMMGECPFVAEGFTDAELSMLQVKAMARFYLRPRHALRLIAKGKVNISCMISGAMTLILLMGEKALGQVRDAVRKRFFGSSMPHRVESDDGDHV